MKVTFKNFKQNHNLFKSCSDDCIYLRCLPAETFYSFLHMCNRVDIFILLFLQIGGKCLNGTGRSVS